MRKNDCPRCGQDLRLPPNTREVIAQIQEKGFSLQEGMSKSGRASSTLREILNLTYEILEKKPE